ncbi:MAG: hypothetical protein M3O50_08850 [Myxococcota bacterium]|nr:hypothetical protein [Myxococcota bacterium]
MIKFTMTAPAGSFTTVPVGRIPGGFRLQISYSENITFAGVATDETPIQGKVLAGADWVLLRDDGVAVFNAQITFQAQIRGAQPEQHSYHVFDAAISGRVLINAARGSWPVNSVADLKTLNGRFPATLPIQFETSNEPPAGASKAMLAAGANWQKFADLATSQFLATGEIEIVAGALQSATLAVASVDDTLRAITVGAAGRSGVAPAMPGPVREDPLANMFLSATETTWPLIRSVPSTIFEHIDEVFKHHAAGASPLFAHREKKWSAMEWPAAHLLIRELVGIVDTARRKPTDYHVPDDPRPNAGHSVARR